LLERSFIASAVKEAMNAERTGLRRRVQDAMDNEMLSERALKSSKVEQCYDFGGGVGRRALWGRNPPPAKS
jgi:hypothetical protein